MEKILYLESDEEITSVIDRVKNTNTKSVALVIPRGALLISGVVNLKLLKKEVDKLGKKVVLVTTDRAAKQLANNYGFEVFEKLDEAIEALPEEFSEEAPAEIAKISKTEESLADSSEIKFRKIPSHVSTPGTTAKKIANKVDSSWQKSKKSFQFNWKYALGGFIFLLLAGAFTAFFLLPRATIALTLKGEEFNKDFRITVDKNLKEVDLAGNTIPGKVITTTKEISKSGKATGKKDVGEPARGTLTLSNAKGVDQPIAAGTIFTSAAGLKFKVESGNKVPSAFLNAAGDKVLGTTQIKVVAVDKGEKYNIKAQSFVSPYSKVTAAGSVMSGGFTKEITVVSKDDAEKLKKEAIKEISANLKEDIKGQVSSGAQVFDEAVVNEILAEDIAPKVDSETKEFKVKVKAKLSSLAYEEKDLNQIADQNLEKVLEGKSLVPGAPKEITKKLVSQNLKDGKLVVDLSVKAQVGPSVDQKLLRENIAGKNQGGALEYLKGFNQVQEAKIDLWPFWVKKVPGLADSVKININYVVSENSSAAVPTSQEPKKAE